jgi:hypothetical protein
MTSSALAVVITSIQPPTESMRSLSSAIVASGGTMLVVGDERGPLEYDLPRAELITLSDQLKLPFELARLLPYGHYARKNIGYLLAFARSFACIYETDDDNAPNEMWCLRSDVTQCQQLRARKWANVYRLFSNDLIWPRGFPLNRVADAETFLHDIEIPPQEMTCPVQQGLADLAPDVDAVWRLFLDREYYFANYKSVWLPPGTWCPFNSQSTWWWPIAYPLMYLPSYCSFRMTDIWRSFVAQRCLWELGYGVVFHPAEVVQERNFHDLMKDFEQEVPGYLHNEQIAGALESLSLRSGREEIAANMIRCYEKLVEKKFVSARELPLIKAWVADVELLECSLSR